MSDRILSAGWRLAIIASLLVLAAGIGASRRPPEAHALADCVANETLDSEELAFLTLLNNHRAQNGRQPLGVSHTLSRAAAWKSKDLGVQAYFAHDDLGRTWVQRIRDCGYRYNTYLGENIAAGVSSAQAAFDLWKNSSGHNANMLGANYTTIGIGREYVAGSPYGWYWTTEFGGVDDGYAQIAEPGPIEALPGSGQPDATPPRLALTADGRGRTVTLNARASDETGVARVEFWADGRLLTTDTSAPYQTRVRPPRHHTVAIEARAYDVAGNVATRTLRWTSR
jgi:uncharacterized protein YkwD